MYHHQSHFLRNIRKIIGGEKTMKCKLSRHFALLLLYTNFEEKKKYVNHIHISLSLVGNGAILKERFLSWKFYQME